MKEVGTHSILYYILITNIYILFIFIFHYWKRTQWFVRYYIIGKSLQVIGFLFIFFENSHPLIEIFHPTSFFIVTGIAFEIFGIISYDGFFNKKPFYVLITAAGLVLLLLIAFMKHNLLHILILDIGLSFFYLYGGIYLIIKTDKSRFRPLIGYTLIIYAIFRFTSTIIANTDIMSMPHMHNLEQGMFAHAAHTAPHFNFEDTSQRLLYFVTVIASISYLIILKEQDELAIAKINKQISKENKSLKVLNEEKNKFFSIVAHDLKGPIGTLANITEMLVEQKKKLEREDYEKWLTIIKESSTRTYTFLNNLLQWARSESDTLHPKPVMINTKELVAEIIKLMDVYAQNKHIKLINKCPDNSYIYADKEMVSTVLRNLISNGIKFTEKDGSISISAKTGNTTTVNVTDTGIGIEPDKAKKIFDLDSQYTTKGTQNEEGTGLGLKLSYEFIEKNNGKMWLKSNPGKGTSFFFSLPSKQKT